jgi:hypothetical protein
VYSLGKDEKSECRNQPFRFFWVFVGEYNADNGPSDETKENNHEEDVAFGSLETR